MDFLLFAFKSHHASLLDHIYLLFIISDREYNNIPLSRWNKAGDMATQVMCGWAGAVFKVPTPFGQEQ